MKSIEKIFVGKNLTHNKENQVSGSEVTIGNELFYKICIQYTHYTFLTILKSKLGNFMQFNNFVHSAWTLNICLLAFIVPFKGP